MDFRLRPITPADDAATATLIRTVMPEFGCVGEGFSIEDPEVDGMSAAYSAPRSAFFVVECSSSRRGAGAENGSGSKKPEGRIIACAGFAPLEGADPDVCELRKMYALPEARGHGIGRELIERCLAGAKAAGFSRMYLETVTGMTAAARLYRRYGFTYITGPLGATGHSGCDRFMLKEL